MKKLSSLTLAALLLAGCGTAVTEEETKAVNGSGSEAPAEVEETPISVETEEAPAEEAAEEATETEEAAEPAGIQAYMPEAGLVKNFEVESYELVREVKEVQGNKVLEEITFGDAKTVQVSEWTENSMHMLIDTAELEGIEDISIDGLEPSKAPVVMIDETNEGEQAWEVTSLNETVTVPAGTYENVIVVTQVIKSETSDQITTTSHYFAPGLGFIKEKNTVENGTDKQETNIDLVSVN